MYILFLTDNYPPETNAPATRTYEHVSQWVAAGHLVTVVTCAPNYPTGRTYPGYRNWPLSVEMIDDVRVIRVWTYMSTNAGFFRRITDYISFAVSASIVAQLLRFDVLVATSPQFFTAVAGWYVGTIRRKPWVFELRDLWPESIKTVGAMDDGIAIRLLERLELFLYRQSTKVVAVTNRFRDNLISRGIRRSKIAVVPNGANTTLFRGNTDSAKGSRSSDIIVGYLGTHGMSHALDFVIRVARTVPDIKFVFVGNGAEKSRIERMARNVPNVELHEPVAKADVPHVLSGFDYALVNLRDTPTFRTVIPSKIFENAAMGIPILLGVDGESREILEHYGAGIAYDPENEDSFRAALQKAKDAHMADDYAKMQDGCRRLATDYDRRKLANKMLQELERLV